MNSLFSLKFLYRHHKAVWNTGIKKKGGDKIKKTKPSVGENIGQIKLSFITEQVVICYIILYKI